MPKVPHLVIPFVLGFCLIACKKDKHEEGDFTFLFSNQMMFSGKIADSSVLWKYGAFEFQRGSGVLNIGADPLQPKYLTFWLTSNADLTTRFEINTASYKDSVTLFSDVLSPGPKEFGPETEKFELELTLNKMDYTTNGDQTHSRLEILKIQNTKDEFNRDMVLVWFKANCKFYDLNDRFAFNLTDGYILAGFVHNF